MENYTYQNNLVSKKQLRQLLSWSFTKYGSVKSCFLADELKYLGFKYATYAGISISLEDLRVPSIKNNMLNKANNTILNAEKLFVLGKITNVERFQKIIDTWNITSELLKDEVVSYFKKHDPLNSIYMMAFSGARGNLSQVRQLVGMRGLMSDPSGEIMNLPIKKNFREGLTITDYLMSGYGARKGIVDTALKTANSGYLTRRLIDVAQDILIREKDCVTSYSFLVNNFFKNYEISQQILGCLLNKPVYYLKTNELIANTNTELTPSLIRILKQKNISNIYIRSPLTCCLYRSICQKCYGWNLSRENLIDIGDAVGIIAGQSIGEPGTQLTMRTFHTGGIFTSATSQQLISPINGYIQFSSFLRASKIRTNKGENVLLTENSGYLVIIADEDHINNIQFELPKNTILFCKNNEYIRKETSIGQLATTVKQIRLEIKPVLSDNSGEIFMPKSPGKLNFTTINKLLWILSGQVFRAPFNSFLNFYSDYKINKNSYIFRSKIINYQSGFIKLILKDNNLFQSYIEIKSTSYYQINYNVFKLDFTINYKNFLITKNNVKFFVTLQNNKLPIRNISGNNGINFYLTINNFLTFTGGTSFYTKDVIRNRQAFSNSKIYIYKSLDRLNFRTIIWTTEEIYQLNCESKFLEVENNNFIPKNFKIIPKIYSRTSGVIKIKEKQNIAQQISIQSGLVYEVYDTDKIKYLNNKIYYPGEIILENIEIKQPCLTTIINVNFPYQVLIQSLQIYEVPLPKSSSKLLKKNLQQDSIFNLTSYLIYRYNSNHKIKTNKNINLLIKSSFLHLTNVYEKKKFVEIQKKTHLKFHFFEKVYFSDYIPGYLKYRDINLCLNIENNQFVNLYSTLGYLETITKKCLELIKVKSKTKKNKQIFLISNDDCLLFSKSKIQNKTINNFLINPKDIKETGKIIIENSNLVTIQKGKPYFFPNCKNDYFIDNTNLEYHPNYFNPRLPSKKSNIYNHNINIQSYNISKNSIHHLISNKTIQYDCSKIIIKKRKNVYTASLPIFLREILSNRKKSLPKLVSTLIYLPIKQTKNLVWLRLQVPELVSNRTKSKTNQSTEFICLERDQSWFGELKTPFPFAQFKLHSVTEDYLKQDVNTVSVKNGEFIDDNHTIGLLNFEKEITGDIVQGLPRIEELLEARKKKKLSKRTSKNQKRSLLIRKTTLDPSFEFRKLGTTIKNNEKINPHNLLKIYFNYYTKIKPIVFQNQKSLLVYLTNPYEASYRSFKKAQSLILNSIQSVYKSQGVYIADKHLEIVIKQMTSKVQIRRAGDTPLLPHEIIDLYHIKYVNDVIVYKQQQPAYYVPLLLGVTKASLNNPSFISAASFQETTRVLTKAAIEGKHDWLRGLKENIVIGQLIPVGTGLQTYSNFFDHFHLSNLILKSSTSMNTYKKA